MGAKLRDLKADGEGRAAEARRSSQAAAVFAARSKDTSAAALSISQRQWDAFLRGDTRALSGLQLRALSPARLQAIPPSLLTFLSAEQLAALRDPHWNDLLEPQRRAMVPAEKFWALVHALTIEDGESPAPPSFIDAGYTYFGQFIAHDIVADARPGKRRHMLGYAMNLDSLYGPSGSTQLTGHGLFRVEASGDLPRNPQGEARIPERRNDDNQILAQLHVLWQRFHNFTITSGCAANATEARRLVTLVFQLLVVEDFLRQVLHPSVFHSYFHLGRRWLGFSRFKMPEHFSHAAFRFGHSMVRPFYKSLMGPHPEVPVSRLFRPGQPLDREHVVNWRGFFGLPRPVNGAQKAMAIDHFVTEHMARIPCKRVRPGDPESVNIIEANLRAGRIAALPAGRAYVQSILDGTDGAAIAQTFGLKPLSSFGQELASRLTDSTVTLDELPLWPYLLSEAMAASQGRHLGVLGSLICGEVIANSIATAQYSIYPRGPASIDEVLATLGPLQKRIEAVVQLQPGTTRDQRTLCMRHIIELVAAHELS